MRTSEARFVWVMIFFDLPTVTKEEKKAYHEFREFLLDDGFLMVQFSVYARVCREDAAEKHIQRVKDRLPPAGNVRALQITDTQYARMRTLIGTVSTNEKIAPNQLVLL